MGGDRGTSIDCEGSCLSRICRRGERNADRSSCRSITSCVTRTSMQQRAMHQEVQRIMTTESTQPQPEQGPAPDNGQVQSRGHRRRRRRRKNKSNQQPAMQGQQMQGQPQPQAEAPAQAAPPQSAPPRPVHHHQQHQNRKKKKFFQKSQVRKRSPATASRARRASARDGRRVRGRLSVPWITAIAP